MIDFDVLTIFLSRLSSKLQRLCLKITSLKLLFHLTLSDLFYKESNFGSWKEEKFWPKIAPFLIKFWLKWYLALLRSQIANNLAPKSLMSSKFICRNRTISSLKDKFLFGGVIFIPLKVAPKFRPSSTLKLFVLQ